MLQAWDFRPGSNFVLEMDRAAKEAEHTIAVLSPDYLTARYTAPEWAVAFSQDPAGQKGKLLPVRVRECDAGGLIGPIVYIDLVGLKEDAARDALIAGVRRGRAKPRTSPRFPATMQRSVIGQPLFPPLLYMRGPRFGVAPQNNIVEKWWSAPASSFKAIFAACAAQPACATAFPNLEADFTATVNRLDKTPVVAQAKDESGSPVTVNIDGFAFAYTLIMTSERGDASGIPKMIADMARGDSGAVAAAYLALRGPPEFVGLGGIGLAITVFCAEHANLTTEAAALAKAKAALPGVPDRVLRVQPKQGRLFTECPIWNVGMADPAVSTPIVSDVPVLILEGTFDAATAPEWVDLITPHLKNSQVVAFPFTGHGVLGKSTCAPSIMAAFLDNPTKPVDQTCAAQTTLTFTR